VKIRFVVNGKAVEVESEPEARALDVLRETLALTGTKEGCGEGECGACTVLIDGRAVNSCLMLAPQLEGKTVLTIEGLAGSHGNADELHPVQQAFVETGGVQCGFCTPGFIMSTVALLHANPNPSDEEIRSALEGNLCRCTGYEKIVEAVHLAAERMANIK